METGIGLANLECLQNKLKKHTAHPLELGFWMNLYR